MKTEVIEPTALHYYTLVSFATPGAYCVTRISVHVRIFEPALLYFTTTYYTCITAITFRRTLDEKKTLYYKLGKYNYIIEVWEAD